MKRKSTIIFALALIIILSAALVACNKKPTPEASNVCRETLAYYAGESDEFAVSIEVGRREKLFIADGKATDVIDFVQLTVTPLKKNDCSEVSYAISGDDKSLEGVLADPDNGVFSATVALDFAPSSVALTAGELSAEIELSNVLDGALSSSDAVNIARDFFKQKAEDEKADGKPDREIYVKLITGDRLSYYYYVSFIGEGVDYWALLIDPLSGEIISEK